MLKLRVSNSMIWLCTHFPQSFHRRSISNLILIPHALAVMRAYSNNYIYACMVSSPCCCFFLLHCYFFLLLILLLLLAIAFAVVVVVVLLLLFLFCCSCCLNITFLFEVHVFTCACTYLLAACIMSLHYPNPQCHSYIGMWIKNGGQFKPKAFLACNYIIIVLLCTIRIWRCK